MEVTAPRSTSIQFGDETTLEYLKGANSEGVSKISVRYTEGDVTSTASFAGGKSLADLIPKALKACGQNVAEPRVPIPLPAAQSLTAPTKELKTSRRCLRPKRP